MLMLLSHVAVAVASGILVMIFSYESAKVQPCLQHKSSKCELPHHTVTSVSDDQIKLSEFTYENQKRERLPSVSMSTSIARFNPEWPCFWGERVTGRLSTYINGVKPFGKRFGDGWKFTCGIHLLKTPCVVYSLG